MKKFGIIYIGDVNYAYCIVNDNKLDLINTRIIDYIYKNYAKNTFKKYTNNILEFLNFIANEYFDLMSCMPDVIRAKITYFLSNKYHAKIIKRLNLEVIHIENNKKSNISTILAALKLYFEISISLKFYKHKNPISNDISYNKKIKDNRIPLMPINSGIRTPDEEKNIIKNHFIINEKKWIPDIIHDINLASKIFKIIQCSNWKLRDLIIARLMFESGARISEICGLTIDDWRDTEFKNGATIFNKGSYLVRTKYLQWSADTTKLLYKYFNEDRKYITKKTLKDYIKNNNKKNYKEHIFLSKNGNPYSDKSFRDIYWNPTIQKSFPSLNIHKIRHWFVTTQLRFFDENYPINQNENLKDGLISYIGWKSGRRMLDVYNHHKNKYLFLEANSKYIDFYDKTKEENTDIDLDDNHSTIFDSLMRLQ